MTSIKKIWQELLQEAPRTKTVTCPNCGNVFTPSTKKIDSDSKVPPEQISDIQEFGAVVTQGARDTNTGIVGSDRKVLINHVAKTLGVKNMDLFKQKVLEAHRAGSVKLARADLAHTLNQQDVKESEIHHFTATYHLIRTT